MDQRIFSDHIIFGSIRLVVDTSVNLNNETGLVAIKISDVPAYWMLPSKFSATQSAVAELAPEDFFSLSLGFAQAPCYANRVVRVIRVFDHPYDSPLPGLRPPLSPRERGRG